MISGKMYFIYEDIVTSLIFNTPFVIVHDLRASNAITITTAPYFLINFGMMDKGLFALLWGNGIHDAFSLNFLISFDNFPFRTVNHYRNSSDIWLCCNEFFHGIHSIQHSASSMFTSIICAPLNLCSTISSASSYFSSLMDEEIFWNSVNLFVHLTLISKLVSGVMIKGSRPDNFNIFFCYLHINKYLQGLENLSEY